MHYTSNPIIVAGLGGKDRYTVLKLACQTASLRSVSCWFSQALSQDKTGGSDRGQRIALASACTHLHNHICTPQPTYIHI